MRLAFATGAAASGLVGAGLTTLLIWLVTLASGSGQPWSSAPILVPGIAAAVAGATYLAERIVYRRSMERQRAIGEPWAYRGE